MRKNIGILYDNISGNTGDIAIGLSLRKIMRTISFDFDELIPSNYNPLLYDSIIIGGGHLLRQNQSFFYDKFKVRGQNILNSIGVVGFPTDLEFLNDYKYLSFRSSGDQKKLNYLKKEIHVVPCTTMLLEDLKEDTIKLNDNSIGIHLLPNFFNDEDEHLFVNWLSNLPYTIYFIPITHYNYDYIYMNKICKQLNNAHMLPIMKPMEIFTVIGKLNYFISCSLHGSIFSYIHNVPFILMDQEKSRFFLEDRYLEKYLFSSLTDIINLSQELLIKPIDYSHLIIKDRNVLQDHVRNIKECIGPNAISSNSSGTIEKSDILFQVNHQIHTLQSGITECQSIINELRSETYNLHSYKDTLQQEVNSLQCNLEDEHNKNLILENEKNKILNSKGWKLLKFIYKIKELCSNSINYMSHKFTK